MINIPEAGDSYWRKLCKPLQDFIALKDRTRPELQAWRASQRLTVALFQNMLAWLSLRGAADAHMTPTGRVWSCNAPVDGTPPGWRYARTGTCQACDDGDARLWTPDPPPHSADLILLCRRCRVSW